LADVASPTGEPPAVSRNGGGCHGIPGPRLGDVPQLVEAGVQELQHRCAGTVLLLVVDQRGELVLVEGADAVAQRAEWGLVVVEQWQ
jgi:hypothetical protein